MALKKRNNNITEQSIEKLANDLADKPYDEEKDSNTRITITLPLSLLHRLEDLAIRNKRDKEELRSISSIIREAIKNYLSSK